ncbi:hypothetical protein [Sphingobacterium psychroaquaticum]|nr:hypothetical protein [Sphingobacterium psychroaquaticum]
MRKFIFISLFMVLGMLQSFCQEGYKSFKVHENRYGKYITIGNGNNTLFEKYELNDSVQDPNIFKTTYRDELGVILSRYLARTMDGNSINKDQNLYLDLYFDPKTFTVKEVYFVSRNIELCKVIDIERLGELEKEIKKDIQTTTNTRWINEIETNRQLNNSVFVRHLIGFSVLQLYRVHKGELDKKEIASF